MVPLGPLTIGRKGSTATWVPQYSRRASEMFGNAVWAAVTNALASARWRQDTRSFSEPDNVQPTAEATAGVICCE